MHPESLLSADTGTRLQQLLICTICCTVVLSYGVSLLEYCLTHSICLGDGLLQLLTYTGELEWKTAPSAGSGGILSLDFKVAVCSLSSIPHNICAQVTQHLCICPGQHQWACSIPDEFGSVVYHPRVRDRSAVIAKECSSMTEKISR